MLKTRKQAANSVFKIETYTFRQNTHLLWKRRRRNVPVERMRQRCWSAAGREKSSVTRGTRRPANIQPFVRRGHREAQGGSHAARRRCVPENASTSANIAAPFCSKFRRGCSLLRLHKAWYRSPHPTPPQITARQQQPKMQL